MKINHNREADKLTVAIEGKLDTTTAPEFEKNTFLIPVFSQSI